MSGCICCNSSSTKNPLTRKPGKSNLPFICLVPREEPSQKSFSSRRSSRSTVPPSSSSNFSIIDEDVLRKHFKFPEKALYLDPTRRPLITFPMTQEIRSPNFSMYRKTKTNQMILDGLLDASEAVVAGSVFPYDTKTEKKKKSVKIEEDEEIVYVLQLPDLETRCPVHNQIIKTPRFVWHSCKNKPKDSKQDSKQDCKQEGQLKRGKGPMHRPKPWLLSRHTDFDLMSQW